MASNWLEMALWGAEGVCALKLPGSNTGPGPEEQGPTHHPVEAPATRRLSVPSPTMRGLQPWMESQAPAQCPRLSAPVDSNPG